MGMKKGTREDAWGWEFLEFSECSEFSEYSE